MTGEQRVLEESLQALPFSKPRQEALLGYLLLDDKFYNQAKLRLKREWFLEFQCGQIWEALVNESNRLGRKLKPAELKDSLTFQRADQKERASLCAKINKCLEQTSNYGLDTLTPELTDWLHARIYVETIHKSSALFNAAQTAVDAYDKRKAAYLLLKDMGRQIDDITFETGAEVSWNDWLHDTENLVYETKESLSFGVSAVDRLMLPPIEGLDAELQEQLQGGGSLLRGDTTVLLAPTNVGKTSAMVTIAVNAVKSGKNVLFITHEGRPEDIKLKIRMCFSGLTRGEWTRACLRSANDPSLRAAFDEMASVLSRHLVYVPINKPGLTIEDVAVVIQRHLDRFSSKHGEKFDLIVDDYLAKLGTVQNSRGQLQRRQMDDVIYNYGVQLALDHQVHFLTAIQSNRDGSKINRRQKGVENRLLTMEDVAESWGPMTAATNVISLNRDPIAIARGRVTYHICKSRSSEVGWSVVCRSNFKCCITHHEDYGATWYRGSSPMAERIDELLTQYMGQAIPDEKVLHSTD
jgi:replicative DNA helicase